MSWKVPRMWDGSDVWILGGGPSIPEQFGIPEEVTQQVVTGTTPPSVYSSYMEVLHERHIIGVNMAYRIGNWIDIVAFGDSGFFLREREGLSKFPGLKVAFHSTSKNETWVKFLGRDPKSKGLSTNSGRVCWNGNSGAAAINVAVHTGAKRIFLLGFDMKIGVNKFQHWHNLYNKGPVQDTDQRRVRKLPFERHMVGFPVIAEDAKALGITIINVCPDSAIQCFQKMTLKEALEL